MSNSYCTRQAGEQAGEQTGGQTGEQAWITMQQMERVLYLRCRRPACPASPPVSPSAGPTLHSGHGAGRGSRAPASFRRCAALGRASAAAARRTLLRRGRWWRMFGGGGCWRCQSSGGGCRPFAAGFLLEACQVADAGGGCLYT